MLPRASLVPLGLALILAGPPAFAQSLSDDDLPFREENGAKLKLFMDSETFAGDAGYSWSRDDVELEAAYTASCIPGADLQRMLYRNGMRRYRQLRRSEEIEAYSVGFPVDEIPWTGRIHDVREGRIPWENGRSVIPYVWLRIESDRFAVDEEEGARRLSLGLDIMDDIYYDSDDFILLRHDMSIRGRKRWDTSDTMRRLLIALKQEGGVDEFGIKRAAKMDIREDMPSAEAITGLDEAVMRGLDSWDGDPAPPLKRTYNWLKNRGKLPSSPSFQDVLAIEPKAFVRSWRSRYHLNECNLSDLKSLHELGRNRLERLLALSRESRLDGAIPANRLDAVQAFERLIQGALDHTAVAERAKARLAGLGYDLTTSPIDALLPGSAWSPSTSSLDELANRRVELERRRAVAEAVSALYHEITAALDDGSSDSIRRLITRSMDRSLEDYVEPFVAWQKVLDTTARVIQTLDPFVERHEAALGNPDALVRFNAWGSQQVSGFQPLSQDQFDALRFQLRNEQVRIWARQIESAGSVALGLWFDEAREFYVPGSYRSTGNFMIDTVDFSAMYKADVWGDLAPPERTPGVDLGQAPYLDKLIHSTLVNEVQIELGTSAAYTDRLKQLRSTWLLPHHFMRWAAQAGLAADADAAKVLFEELKSLEDDALQARLAPFNDYLAAQGAPIAAFSADEFRDWLEPERLTAEVLANGDPDDPALEAALEGAKFVFEQYRDMLTFVAKLKRRRILDVLEREDAPACTDWVPAPASKGNQALELIRALETGSSGGSGGLVGALTGNTTVEKAAAVERRSYDLVVPNQGEAWFKLELAPGEGARFQVEGAGPGKLDMALHRLTGNPPAMRLWRAAESPAAKEEIRYATGSGRTVWIRVYGSPGSRYRLTVE